MKNLLIKPKVYLIEISCFPEEGNSFLIDHTFAHDWETALETANDYFLAHFETNLLDEIINYKTIKVIIVELEENIETDSGSNIPDGERSDYSYTETKRHVYYSH